MYLCGEIFLCCAIAIFQREIARRAATSRRYYAMRVRVGLINVWANIVTLL